ncbi:MAG: hypothetical protein JXR96_14420 [Deltaproteobacteria bacterium]|nr:hypothetical protein [Deltaproteobacteria bacterium]
MTLSLECMHCEADFELDLADLLRDPGLFSCPNCGASADPEIVELAMGALDEALSQLGRLRRKFRIELTVESDDLGEDEDELFDDGEEEGALWANDVEDEEDEV